LKASKLKWWLFLIVASTVACGTASLPPVSPSASPTEEVTDEPTEVVTIPGQPVDTRVNDVTVGIRVPVGWEVQITEDGLLMAERFGKMGAGRLVWGMQVHVFVYRIDDVELAGAGDNDNVAWHVLKTVTSKRQYIGNAAVSEPQPFQWDAHDAAYYLLNNGDGNVMLVVAVALDEPRRLVVCNFTAPSKKAAYIRSKLPQMLSTLTLNGLRLNVAALHALPDPLVFPAYSRPEATRMAR
jgi:hypothetical protein